MNEQTFVPPSMRALYYSLAPAIDTAMVTPLDEDDPDIPASIPKPIPGTGLILDTGFPTPIPSAHQYLLKVQSAAFCQDELRLASALNPVKTTPQIPLHSLCGTVITTPEQDHERPLGPRFKIGDCVFGVVSYTRDGGAADYTVATEGELALKPSNISAAEASALALPALTAWQALFRYAGLDPDAPANGNGNGNGKKNGHENGNGNGNGHRRSLSWLTGNGNGSHSRRPSLPWFNGNGKKESVADGVGDANGNGHGPNSRKSSGSGSTSGRSGSASGNGHQWLNGNGFRKRKVPPLRVLVTNARDSEVGRIAVQLLRADKLFEHAARPWICVTCTAAEEGILRQDWDVDEILMIPHLPAQNECDLGKMFRSRKWSPVDVVLDCTGGEVFRQAHGPHVVKDYGAVLTVVDPRPAQEPTTADEQDVLGRRKRGLRSRFVPVNPDSAALARIADLVERNMVRGREEQVVDLVNASKLLEAKAAAAAGSRRGGMMVVRVN